jgi:hypothetical protein
MATDMEEPPVTAHLRVIYAMHRINALLEEQAGSAGHELPEDTLDLVSSCLDAISDLIERRKTLDAEKPNVPDAPWHRPGPGRSH